MTSPSRTKVLGSIPADDKSVERMSGGAGALVPLAKARDATGRSWSLSELPMTVFPLNLGETMIALLFG